MARRMASIFDMGSDIKDLVSELKKLNENIDKLIVLSDGIDGLNKNFANLLELFSELKGE